MKTILSCALAIITAAVSPKSYSIITPNAQRLDWIAQSRGLALERGIGNIGPISPYALHALKQLAIVARGADRFPQQCTAGDLAGADFIVAVKEAEHRPLISKRFPEWEHLVDYWNVDDVEDAKPREALRVSRRKFRRSYFACAERLFKPRSPNGAF